jgi:hypothetical protein
MRILGWQKCHWAGSPKLAGSHAPNRDTRHAHIVAAELEEAAARGNAPSTRKVGICTAGHPALEREAPTHAEGGNSSAQQSAAVDNNSSIVKATRPVKSDEPHRDRAQNQTVE